MFDDGPRTWKYAVPASVLIVLIPVTGLMMVSKNQTVQYWSMVPLMFGVLLAAITLVNLWAYIARHWADTLADVQVAKNSTPEVRMFEAAKGMHPEAVNALLVHRRSVWRIKYVAHKDLVDWIFDEMPTVHAGFLDFVLDHSNGALMPKRLLSKDAKQFDPEGLITDYQQYDDLVTFLQQKLIITSAAGNQSPKFIPPWNAELIRHRFGLDGEGYGIEPEMSEALRAVVKAQARAAISEQQSMSSVPAVIQNALDGLEQTADMRLKTNKLNS